jgi:hypothetical protein
VIRSHPAAGARHLGGLTKEEHDRKIRKCTVTGIRRRRRLVTPSHQAGRGDRAQLTNDPQVACVNPAGLGGGTADLDPYLLTASQTETGLKEPVPTPWVTYPVLYSVTCQQHGGATWLQVTSLAGTSRTRPVVNQDIVPGTPDTGPAWGYHGYEYNLTLGNLLHDVAGEEAAWQSSH